MNKKLIEKYIKYKDKNINPFNVIKWILSTFFSGSLIYMITIALAAFTYVLDGFNKVIFMGIAVVYLPFAIYNFFSKKDTRMKILFPACFMNIILCLGASIFEVIDLKTIQIGFKNIMIVSILNTLTIYYIKEYVEKSIVVKVVNWGSVLILLVIGILLLV